MLSADESLPLRPAQPVEGLSRGHGARGVGSRSDRRSSTSEHDIDLKLERARRGDRHRRAGTSSSPTAAAMRYDALLLATGAEPVRLDVPGADLPHVHYLRTLADSRALVAKASASKRAVVIGASFIGLEVAASLRARNIEVHVVGPETVRWRRSWGRRSGISSASSMKQHGVTFHLGTTAAAIDEHSVTLEKRRTARRPISSSSASACGRRSRWRNRRGSRSTAALRSTSTWRRALRDLRRRRHRALAGPAHRRADPRRALGGRRAPGPDGGAQHPRPARALRCRAVLLDRAIRFRPRPMSVTPSNGTKPRSTGRLRPETARSPTGRRQKLAVAVVSSGSRRASRGSRFRADDGGLLTGEVGHSIPSRGAKPMSTRIRGG